jgi:AbrB family looped-hinge helix DNA binding protein
VKVNNRYQIVIPAAARAQLNIQRGDRLLVDIQDGMLILIPQPENYTAQLAGLHQEIWTEVDAQEFINQERDAWPPSPSN